MTIESSRDRMSALRWAGILADTIAASALVIVLFVTVATIVLRTLRLNLPDALDFASLFMGIAMFWGLSVAFLNDSNIRVEFLSSLLGRNGQRALRVISNIIAVAAMGTIAYAGYRYLQTAIHSGEITPQLRVRIWPFIGFAWLGLCMTAVGAIAAAFVRIAPGQDRQIEFEG